MNIIRCETNLGCLINEDSTDKTVHKSWIKGGVTAVVTPSSTASLAGKEKVDRRLFKGDSGRIPANRMAKDEGISEEEEKRIIVKRERNKQAAARCRKRRADQTESLQKQVNESEHKKSLLLEEIKALQTQKEELQFILDAHNAHCKRTQLHTNSESQMSLPNPHTNVIPNPKAVVKSEPIIERTYDQCPHEDVEKVNLDVIDLPTSSISTLEEKPQRPQSLGLNLTEEPNLLKCIGVTIETPTSIVKSLNFEDLMEGRTGLTPTNVLTPISLTISDNFINTPSITKHGVGSNKLNYSPLEFFARKSFIEISSPSTPVKKLLCL